MKPSVIRALLKLVQQSDVISFAGGTPDAELFPRPLLAELASKAILEQGRLSLQYGETVGYRPFREEVCRYLRGKGIACEAENILITTGSQEGLFLLSMALLDPGDRILVEEPSYLGALLTFRNFQGQCMPVHCGPDGLDPAELEKTLESGLPAHPKFLYTIPSFQNPAGSTLPDAARKRLMELAVRRGLLVVEDDPYGELNYSGEPLKPVKSHDPGHQAVYLGSFSKIAAPGMRLGWVCAAPELIGRLTMAKETVDVCTDVLSQAIATEFFKSGALASHLDKLCSAYKARRDVMLESIRKFFPAEVQVNQPKGGFFVWAQLPQGLSASRLFPAALEKKVAYVVGEAFHAAEGRGENTLRLTFCAVDETRIAEGIQRLGGVFKDALVAPRR
jgi:2-aminoadipate transaminase